MIKTDALLRAESTFRFNNRSNPDIFGSDKRMLNWLSKEFLLAVIVALAIALVAISWGGTPDQYIQQQGSEQFKSDQSGTEQSLALQIECNPNCAAKNSNGIRKSSSGMRLINKLVDDPATLGILIVNFFVCCCLDSGWRRSRDDQT